MDPTTAFAQHVRTQTVAGALDDCQRRFVLLKTYEHLVRFTAFVHGTDPLFLSEAKRVDMETAQADIMSADSDRLMLITETLIQEESKVRELYRQKASKELGVEFSSTPGVLFSLLNQSRSVLSEQAKQADSTSSDTSGDTL